MKFITIEWFSHSKLSSTSLAEWRTSLMNKFERDNWPIMQNGTNLTFPAVSWNPVPTRTTSSAQQLKRLQLRFKFGFKKASFMKRLFIPPSDEAKIIQCRSIRKNECLSYFSWAILPLFLIRNSPLRRFFRLNTSTQIEFEISVTSSQSGSCY